VSKMRQFHVHVYWGNERIMTSLLTHTGGGMLVDSHLSTRPIERLKALGALLMVLNQNLPYYWMRVTMLSVIEALGFEKVGIPHEETVQDDDPLRKEDDGDFTDDLPF